MFRFAVSRGRTLTRDYSSINRLHCWASDNQIESRNLHHELVVQSCSATRCRGAAFSHASPVGAADTQALLRKGHHSFGAHFLSLTAVYLQADYLYHNEQ